MRKLVTSRIFRCVVCLILVCCLLVSWSPIRARAVVAEEVFVTGTGTVLKLLPAAAGTPLWVYVVGLVIVALGIVGAASAVNLAYDFVDYYGEADVSVYYNPDGSWSYGVDMSFVEKVRTFLFDRGYIISNPSFTFATDQTVLCAGTEYVLSANKPFAVVGL